MVEVRKIHFSGGLGAALDDHHRAGSLLARCEGPTLWRAIYLGAGLASYLLGCLCLLHLIYLDQAYSVYVRVSIDMLYV